MPADPSDSILDYVLDELDFRARPPRAERDQEDWTCKRRHPRYPFRSGCVVRFLPAGSWAISELPGRTRNLSRGGIGLLVRRTFAVGEPVELEIHTRQRPRMFMAGVVSFCRYAGRGYHEVGLTLKFAGPQPVFSDDPKAAARTYGWLQRQAEPL